MLHLNLSALERSILVEVLDSALSDLRMEIVNTDQMDFREVLKARRDVLSKIREALELEVKTL